MDTKLLDKITRVEEDIVSAALTGDGDLAVYDLAWTSLLDEISQASAFGDINSATLAGVDDAVARVSALVDCCLSLSSARSPSFPILDANTSPPSLDATSFVPDAHAWLLKNIANPYPSAEFKASLAQRHNSPVSAISSWFTGARRRIGWTTVCRDFFHNCRADAVDAAYRVLVREDSNHHLGSEVVHAFVAVKVAAEELCASSTKSALAVNFDTVLKDMLAEDGTRAKHGVPGDSKRMEGLRVHDKRMQEHSICAQGNKETAQINPDPSYSLLQSPLSRLDPAPAASPGDVIRLVEPHRHPSPSACLPPLSTSVKVSLENEFRNHSSYLVQGPRSSEYEYVANPRKRRLSDPHHTEILKRQRSSLAEPLSHTFSDSLPLSTVDSEQSIDEWFKTNFDTLFAVPPPVDVAEPEASTQWEVELFNKYALPESSQETLPPHISDYQLLPSTDLTVLDDLLQSSRSDEFIPSQQITHPPSFPSTSDSVSHGPPLLPDLSQTIDWSAFLDFPSESTGDPILSQPYVHSVLPEVDPSVLQLLQAWTAVAS